MESIVNSSLRGILIYLILLFLIRIIGRKVISQMTFFDFVIGIMLGSVAANSAIGPYSHNLAAGIATLLILTILVTIIGYINIKSITFRKYINSEPLVLIEKGQIINQNLKDQRLTLNSLMAMLREKNIFNIADVEYAILEYNGNLSVLPKSEIQPLAPKDINIITKPAGLTTDLILDGEVMQNNLENAQISKDSLTDKLKGYGIISINEVFYAGIDSTGRLYISRKNDLQD